MAYVGHVALSVRAAGGSDWAAAGRRLLHDSLLIIDCAD